MFGLKKSINYTESSSLASGSDSVNERKSNSKFIFYDNENKFTSQIELYIHPNNFPDKKLLIIIDSNSNFTELNEKIKKGLQTFSEFKNINGFRIENICKINNGKKIILPLEGNFNNQILSGDIIYCDILSEEYWIETYFKLQSYKYHKTFTIEYKLRKKMKYKYLKLVLLKAGLDLFLKDIKKNILDSSLNYYVKQAKFQTYKNRKTSLLNKKKHNLPNEKIVDAHSIIIATIKLGIFEELIHNQLITMELNGKEHNYLRLNEYCNLLFDELLTFKKFESELITIKDIAKDLIKSQYNDYNSSFLFYNSKTNETINDYMYNILSTNEEVEEDEEDEDDDDYEQFTKSKGSSILSGFFKKVGKSKKEKYAFFEQNQSICTMKKDNFDINMIILAPFLFIIPKENNYKEKKNKEISDIKSSKPFRTSMHNKNNNRDNIGKNKNNDDLMILEPLSLEIGSKLFDDNESNSNNNNELNESTNKYFYDFNNSINEDVNGKSDYLLMDNFDISFRSSRGLFHLLRLSRRSSICTELNTYFNQETFLSSVKKNFKNYISKKHFERAKVPEYRDIEIVENDSLYRLLKNEKENYDEDKGRPKIKSREYILFLVVFFVFYLFFMSFMNLNIVKLFSSK